MTRRRCRERDCITILSASNPEDRCYVHARPRFPDNGNRPSRIREAELEGLFDEHGPPPRMTKADRLAYITGAWLRHDEEETG
jgi:hypothetical protein